MSNIRKGQYDRASRYATAGLRGSTQQATIADQQKPQHSAHVEQEPDVPDSQFIDSSPAAAILDSFSHDMSIEGSPSSAVAVQSYPFNQNKSKLVSALLTLLAEDRLTPAARPSLNE